MNHPTKINILNVRLGIFMFTIEINQGNKKFSENKRFFFKNQPKIKILLKYSKKILAKKAERRLIVWRNRKITIEKKKRRIDFQISHNSNGTKHTGGPNWSLLRCTRNDYPFGNNLSRNEKKNEKWNDRCVSSFVLKFDEFVSPHPRIDSKRCNS